MIEIYIYVYDIKRAYRKKMSQYPPAPEQGHTEATKNHIYRISYAFYVLTDEEKRKTYDRRGENGLNAGMFGGGDMFERFFQNDMNMHDQKTSESRLVEGGKIFVSLEEIYKGTVIQVGGDRVFIERGYDTQTRAISNGKSYKVEVKRHKVFERKKDNLFMKKTISLKESLLGFSFTVRHLDGKDILISSVPGEVIENRSVKMIVGKGMPIFHDTEDNFGNLCIEFVVEFPKSIKLDHSEAPYFSELGEEGRPEDLGIETERVYLSDVYWNETNSVPRGGNSEDIDDAISSEEKNKVQCNVQ